MKNPCYKIISIIILCLGGMQQVAAADQLSRSMSVQTTLDKNEFFDGELSAYFRDELLYIDVEGEKLLDTTTILHVQLDNAAPETLLAKHRIFLRSNIATCYEYDTESEAMVAIAGTDVDEGYAETDYTTTLMTPYIDGAPLTAETPVDFEFATPENGSNSVITDHEFTLTFAAVPKKGLTLSCEGEVSVMVEFAL